MKSSLTFLFAALTALSFNASAESVWDPEKPHPRIEKPLEITVNRSASCGCCAKWISHMEKHNFKINDNVTEDMAQIKKQLGLPMQLASCHTAVIDGYVIEGHVPAQDIIRLVREKPQNIAGLSVPGMPMGTPGMEAHAGVAAGRKDDFNIIAWDKNGKPSIYRTYKDY